MCRTHEIPLVYVSQPATNLNERRSISTHTHTHTHTHKTHNSTSPNADTENQLYENAPYYT